VSPLWIRIEESSIQRKLSQISKEKMSWAEHLLSLLWLPSFTVYFCYMKTLVKYITEFYILSSEKCVIRQRFRVNQITNWNSEFQAELFHSKAPYLCDFHIFGLLKNVLKGHQSSQKLKCGRLCVISFIRRLWFL
jgi:hypothetical protein